MADIDSEIRRFRSHLAVMGFGDDFFAPGLSREEFRQAVARYCPSLVGCPIPEEAYAWFGWQTGIAPDENGVGGRWGFAPDAVMLDALKGLLELTEHLADEDIVGYLDQRFNIFPMFSTLGGSGYALCETNAGWRLFVGEVGGRNDWVPVPQHRKDLQDEDAPTLTEWLRALNDAIDDGRVYLTDTEIDRERPPPNDDWTSYYQYPWR